MIPDCFGAYQHTTRAAIVWDGGSDATRCLLFWCWCRPLLRRVHLLYRMSSTPAPTVLPDRTQTTVTPSPSLPRRYRWCHWLSVHCWAWCMICPSLIKPSKILHSHFAYSISDFASQVTHCGAIMTHNMTSLDYRIIRTGCYTFKRSTDQR